jgi:hypothetical protein
MQAKFALSLLLLVASSLTSQAQAPAIVWQVGRDDNGWPLTGTTGGPDANFVQENGVISPLPGSPNSTPTPQGADNDYYFSGTYSTILPGNNAFYGPYTPIGAVLANENSAERAFAAADLDLRYHFNLTPADINNRLLSITFDALNLDDPNATNTDPRHGIEVYFNGVLVMPQLVIRQAQLNQAITTPLFSPAAVDARTGAGPDNIVSLRGINYNGAGGGNWMGIDYVQLNSQIPEPSSALMILSGALAFAPFLRRRRM